MAFFKKSSGKSPGMYPYTNQDMKHVGWCMKKGIKIALQPRSGDEWEIEITIKHVQMFIRNPKISFASSDRNNSIHNLPKV